MADAAGGGIAVVVLTHDSAADVAGCLESIRRSTVPAEVVVVDNASSDESREVVQRCCPEARVIASPRNLGFSAAANIGVRASRAGFVMLLNPDARLAPGALEALALFLSARPGAAAVGPLVRNPDRTVQPSKRAFPTLWQSAMHGIVGLVWPGNPGTRAYLLADAPLDRPARVGWLSCSAVMLRREAFEKVGGFDERFFFFVEDVDLCRRLSDAGWELWFDPGAEAEHAWGGTWTQKPLRNLWLHHANLMRYALKHRRGASALAAPVIAAGLALRFTLLAIRWLLARRALPPHASGRSPKGASS
ncbi:MAG TPA: glycosyltransferase family 2 protein [Actinomycetota bacterium]|nr:glycosyltransferase family 2 protein [Actinomycetota bacterium]